MGRFKILVFALALFSALITDTECQWKPPEVAPRPLCVTQITLANYACSMLHSSTDLPSPPSTPSLSTNRENEGSLPSSHNHHHGRQHEHEHEIPLSPFEANCCKWVRQLDSECICGLLSHLPVFLVRPQHNFSVTVGGSCDATYSCGEGTRT